MIVPLHRSTQDHYRGNTLNSDGFVNIDPAVKDTTEIDIPNAKSTPAWLAVRVLLY